MGKWVRGVAKEGRDGQEKGGGDWRGRRRDG